MLNLRRRRRILLLLGLILLGYFCVTLPTFSCSVGSSVPVHHHHRPSPPTGPFSSSSRLTSLPDRHLSSSNSTFTSAMVSISSLLCRPCIFCSILEGDPPDKLIYKDEYIAAFHDINPAAETHILIIPVKHITSVKTVKPEDVDILKRMQAKGQEILAERGYNSSNSKLGFHVPPFNTIDHLHLHVLGGEYKNAFRRKKYESGRMWYMDMSQLLEKVEKMKKIQESARL